MDSFPLTVCSTGETICSSTRPRSGVYVKLGVRIEVICYRAVALRQTLG